MKRLLITVICASLVLFSCGSGGEGPIQNNGGGEGHKEKTKWVSPAQYISGDISYTVTLTDDVREVRLNVERKGGVSTASVTYPEELSNVSIVDDVEGVRMFTGIEEMEFVVSKEASAGLTALLDIVSTELSDEERADDGSFIFCLYGVDIKLFLNEDGYPDNAELTWEGYTRKVTFSFSDLNER